MSARHAGHAAMPSPDERAHRQTMSQHYARLLAMTLLSFLAMYALMYAMVNSIANVYNNVNQVYMAGLMAAAMVIIELAVMRSMYHNRKLNAAIAIAGIVALGGFWFLVREQGAVADRQFLRSMIPHHASAILMCEKASISDPEIKNLCKEIISSQASEIRQMKAILGEPK